MYHLGNMFYGSWASPGFGFGFSLLGNILLWAVIIWSVIWKGLALWKSARAGSKVWFVVLILVNTLGILEILYLYVFSKNKATMLAEEKK